MITCRLSSAISSSISAISSRSFLFSAITISMLTLSEIVFFGLLALRFLSLAMLIGFGFCIFSIGSSLLRSTLTAVVTGFSICFCSVITGSCLSFSTVVRVKMPSNRTAAAAIQRNILTFLVHRFLACRTTQTSPCIPPANHRNIV